MKTVPCKGCGKPVIFVKDEKGTTQVLDASAPVYQATSYRTTAGLSSVVFGLQSGDFDQITSIEGVQRTPIAWVSHFSTCNVANQFSKSTKRKGATS